MSLPNVKLSKNEYDSMKWAFLGGSEAFVIKKGKYANKIFRPHFGHKDFSEGEIEVVRENKLRKIEKIYLLGEKFPNAFKPIQSYSYQGKFIGYQGLWFSYPELRLTCLSLEEKIFYLKKIKEKLEVFHELGIVYGDIKDDNILINSETEEVIFLDIDNMQVGANSIDLVGRFAREFISHYGRIDEKLDSYMFNLLTIEYLCECSGWYDEVKERLKLGRIPVVCSYKDYYSRNKRLAREMVRVNSSYSGDYFIDAVKMGWIAKG